MFRILLWSFLFYFVARVIWKIIMPFLAPSESQPHKPSEEEPQPQAESREQFNDVRDAKFEDVPGESSTGDSTQSDSSR